MRQTTSQRSILTILMTIAILLGFALQPAQAIEVSLDKNELERLTSFELHALTKADEAFNKGDFRLAFSSYNAWERDNPRSPLLPYILMRKGRSLQQDNRRIEAIKIYDEVLDYFPNDVKYASASLFYQGLAHWDNGNEDKAMRAWARMASDKDYSKTPLAAHALNRLAKYFEGRDQQAQAVKYYDQVARQFRDANNDAANRAIEQIIPFYIRTQPDEPALRDLYKATRGFDSRPRGVEDDVTTDRRYWEQIRSHVWKQGNFNDIQREQEMQYFAYWAKAMEGRFPDWDDYQIDRMKFLHRAENRNNQNYYKRMDEQFAKYQKDGDFRRIIRWIREYNRWHMSKAKEYYEKIDFAKMSNDDIYELARVLRDDLKDDELSLNAFEKIRLSEADDNFKRSVIDYLRRFGSKALAISTRVADSFSDVERGQMELLYSLDRWNARDEAIELATKMTESPDYAGRAFWVLAENLAAKREYAKAIAAYTSSDREPDKLWAISNTYARMGNLEKAVSYLREVENFYEAHRSEAAMRIAHLYRDAGLRQDYVRSLRQVLNKYPKSRQSSSAHAELEELEERLAGGVDGD